MMSDEWLNMRFQWSVWASRDISAVLSCFIPLSSRYRVSVYERPNSELWTLLLEVTIFTWGKEKWLLLIFWTEVIYFVSHTGKEKVLKALLTLRRCVSLMLRLLAAHFTPQDETFVAVLHGISFFVVFTSLKLNMKQNLWKDPSVNYQTHFILYPLTLGRNSKIQKLIFNVWSCCWSGGGGWGGRSLWKKHWENIIFCRAEGATFEG